ncbi:hypothetical protein SAMN05660748_3270 [Blastococcus aggregatus]|uniref:Uncharacterized protein n=1 Tax=Blastococcus aggregatus TaxID=38502 RepID=A0A285V8W8_9ACTN|nr:hypothetical protein [Blastococcus aggregatus]SOC50520.1 hypothetical protein SAMN05660748_3270 [Blastococcus aggregatus]
MTQANHAMGAVLAAACVLALGGCSSDEPEEVVRTSGALADGFEIEPGSGLVGTVFPSGDEGLHVFLRVDEDMERVFEGYARQAGELGYPVTAPGWWPDGQWCSDDPERWNSSVGEDTPFEVECSAYGSDIDESDGPPYRSMSLRGLAEPDGSGYLEISGGEFSGAPTAPRSPVEDGPVAPLTDAEVVAPDLAVNEDDPLLIVEGSELVFDPFPSTCATGGWEAMIRVTGDLLPVMRGYAEQIDAMRAFSRAEVVGDEDQPSVYSSAAGGGDLYAVGVAGDPSYILLGRCND